MVYKEEKQTRVWFLKKLKNFVGLQKMHKEKTECIARNQLDRQLTQALKLALNAFDLKNIVNFL